MNINKISFTNYNRTFTASTNDDVHIFGYDDAISREKRNLIREHYFSEVMPYYDIFSKESRLEEYPLKKLMSTLMPEKKNIKPLPKNIDSSSLLNLPLYNMRNISNSGRYQPNIYRGQTLCGAFDYVIDTVKKSGIKTVIDYVGYGDFYKKNIEKAGLEYFELDIEKYCYNDLKDGSIPRKFIEHLVDFIKKVQDEYVYMGCEFGTTRTDYGVMLNKIFNPKLNSKCCDVLPEIYSSFLKSKNPLILYKNLTEEDKLNMGWNKKFETKIVKLLTKYVK